LASCIGWLLDVSIEHDKAVIWIKTTDRKILKLADSYNPSIYLLPNNESDGLQLLQVLSQQPTIKKVKWEEGKFTNLFDYASRKKLICVFPESIQYYTPLIKRLEKDRRVKQLFNVDLSHIQQYLFNRLKVEPTSKVEVEYDALKLIGISKVDDEKEISLPPFSLMHLNVKTFSGKFRPEDRVTIINVKVEDEDSTFQNNEEKNILDSFCEYVRSKDPDIIVCTGNTVLQYLFTRAQKLGLNLQLGRGEEEDLEYDPKLLIAGRIPIGNSSGISRYSAFDDFGLAGLIERSRFAFLPLELAAKYSMNRLIDSRNCYELIHRGFVIQRGGGISNNNHEHIRTVEELVSRDKGGMIISPQIGLHENIVVLDYDSEYANLIVNHNISYETVLSEGKVDKEKKGLLPTVVEKFLKRRLHFKTLLKELPKESPEYVWCEQRVGSLKNILVCLYGTTGSLWNRYGNVLAFEEINRLSREVLIRTKDIVQGLGYELVYADTDSVFIKGQDATTGKTDYDKVVDILSKETGLSMSIEYYYKFLVLLPLEADEKIEALKHYYGITQEGQLVVRGIEIRRHDIPNFIKQFQTELLYTLFDCKDSAEVTNTGYENALLLVTKAIDRIMTAEDITQKDLVISKLLRQDIEKYKSLFPHVSAAIQLSSDRNGRYPTKGDTIKYIYTNTQHKNPLLRVAALETAPEKDGCDNKGRSLNYDKEKYREMILDAAETVLGPFGFERTVYGDSKKRKGKWWWQELIHEREKDIQTEMT
jgi:DNA polymerase elongation subunit (family B)